MGLGSASAPGYRVRVRVRVRGSLAEAGGDLLGKVERGVGLEVGMG